MKSRKPDELDGQYIKRLEDCNASLQSENTNLKKRVGALNAATTELACNGSLAFQAMAEKAGVRGHPSVSEAVELFDKISHPQWHRDGHIFPKISFPENWDLEDCERWSGDADMLMNSPIADTIEFLEHLKFNLKPNLIKPLGEIIHKLQAALMNGIQGVKSQHGFSPLHMRPIRPGHIKDLGEEDLRDLMSAMGWMALDLAQDMGWANEVLRRDLRAATYRRVCGDLYAMSQFAMEIPEKSNFDIKVFGGENEPF